MSPQLQLQPPSSSWNELLVTVQRCRDLQSRASQQPSPYVVYKFSDFPDYPTATVHDCCEPHFGDVKSYSVLMDVDLDQYLKSEDLRFYVFDYKEEQMDTYVGKARVPLLPLAQDKRITGEGSWSAGATGSCLFYTFSGCSHTEIQFSIFCLVYSCNN